MVVAPVSAAAPTAARAPRRPSWETRTRMRHARRQRDLTVYLASMMRRRSRWRKNEGALADSREVVAEAGGDWGGLYATLARQAMLYVQPEAWRECLEIAERAAKRRPVADDPGADQEDPEFYSATHLLIRHE
jgi:hypothetical protein